MSSMTGMVCGIGIAALAVYTNYTGLLCCTVYLQGTDLLEAAV